MSGERIFVGLGSNLANPLGQVRSAIAALDDASGVRVLRSSSLYRNPPLGLLPQPDYINAVAEISTDHDPHGLLALLHAIEHSHGRRRGSQRHAARTLDLDLLLYGDRRMCTDRLTLPHRAMHERAFVIHPLFEIAPDLFIPALGPIAELARRVPAHALRRVTGAPSRVHVA